MTTLDLITQSLRLIGVLAGNEVPSANESTTALQYLNDMVDSWSTQNMLIYAKVNETFPLVAGQQSYQMGTGAPDFNTARPQKIENAIWQQVQGSSVFNLEIEIINQDQWAALPVPNTQSNIPTKLFVNYTFPYATLYFWPIPLQANNFQMWSWKQLSDFSLLTSLVSLPPGYNKALRYNLAIELAPEFGKEPGPLIVAQATDSKADIKRMNNKPTLLQCDVATIPRKPGFNWLTGE